VDFCIQMIWVKRYLDEMVLDDMKGSSYKVENVPHSDIPALEYPLRLM
jgi:hypothetical protein